MGKPFNKRSNVSFRDGTWYKTRYNNINAAINSLHYGSAIFEGLRCYRYDNGGGYGIFALGPHTDRMFKGSQLMKLNTNEVFLNGTKNKPVLLTRETFMDLQRELVERNVKENPEYEACYVRPIFFFGPEEMVTGYDGPLHLAMFAHTDWSGIQGYADDEITLHISDEHIRPIGGKPYEAKSSGGYEVGRLADLEARANEYTHGLLKGFARDEGGNIIEDVIADMSGGNVIFRRGNIIYFPRTGNSKRSYHFEGITLRIAEKIFEDLRYEVNKETIFKEENLEDIDEAWAVGTAMERKSIVKIGKGKRVIKRLDSDEAARKFSQKFNYYTHGPEERLIELLGPFNSASGTEANRVISVQQGIEVVSALS